MSSLNLLITALVWRQDHDGFTRQDPGFLDVVANKSPDVVRIYLPPDGNCLLSVADDRLRSVNYVNVIVADKQVHLQYLDMDSAIAHCTKGAEVDLRQVCGIFRGTLRGVVQVLEQASELREELVGLPFVLEGKVTTTCIGMRPMSSAKRRMPRFHVIGSSVREDLCNQLNHVKKQRLLVGHKIFDCDTFLARDLIASKGIDYVQHPRRWRA